MTSANRIGVSSGTTSSRGVRALSEKRRAARDASGESGLGCAAAWGRTASGLMALIVRFLSVGSGGVGETRARQLEVDVVQVRLPRTDRRRREVGLVNDRDRAGRRPVVQGHR